MKKLILAFLLLIGTSAYACQCPLLAPISKENSDPYNVIFYGKVDSVGSCNAGGIAAAYFSIIELYKGKVEKQQIVKFDCASECMMSFSKGEEWIIYGKYVKFDMLKVEMCEHSRKHYSDEAEDIYLLASQRTFDSEREFLKTTFGIRECIQANDINKIRNEIGPRNEQPSGWGKLVLLLVSFAAMGAVYFFTRKKK